MGAQRSSCFVGQVFAERKKRCCQTRQRAAAHARFPHAAKRQWTLAGINRVVPASSSAVCAARPWRAASLFRGEHKQWRFSLSSPSAERPAERRPTAPRRPRTSDRSPRLRAAFRRAAPFAGGAVPAAIRQRCSVSHAAQRMARVRRPRRACAERCSRRSSTYLHSKLSRSDFYRASGLSVYATAPCTPCDEHSFLSLGVFSLFFFFFPPFPVVGMQLKVLRCLSALLGAKVSRAQRNHKQARNATRGR